VNIEQHWLKQATPCPSPNYNERPSQSLDLLVVHNISLPPNQFDNGFIEDFFCNQLDCSLDPYFDQIKGLKVSAHLLIKRDGSTVQFVPFDKRAWHAGVSHFAGRDNCNDFSIGIELEGADDVAYTAIQYEVLAEVSHCICAEYKIASDHIVGHSDIAPGRKTDPGPSFDWVKFKQIFHSADNR